LQEQLTKVQRELDESKEVINASKQFMTGIEERAKIAAVESLRAERREAMRNNDPDAFDAADAKLREIEAPAPRQEERRAPQIPPEIQAVVKRHNDEATWYNEDPELKSFADSVADTLKKQGFNPVASPEAADDFLSKIRDRTMRAYPEKFGRKNGNGKTPMFEGANAQRQATGGPKSFEKMRPEFQQACDKLISKGMVKSRESYIKYAPPDAFY